MGVPLPFRLRDSSLPVVWIFIFVVDVLWGVSVPWVRTSGQGTGLAMGGSASSPSTSSSSMDIFLLEGHCWVTSEHRAGVGCRSRSGQGGCFS